VRLRATASEISLADAIPGSFQGYWLWAVAEWGLRRDLGGGFNEDPYPGGRALSMRSMRATSVV
jgi:hypothetical protein